ncbi:methylthioribulose-1-phosphate dehydratase-like [Glandiceps talaboti]
MEANGTKCAKDHPRQLIPELLTQFYHMGWVTGTGGGITIKHGNEIYIAPSGVQKERVVSDDLFVMDAEEKDICVPPPSKKLKKSACTPLFMNAYDMRDAKACIHSHSKYANLVTMLSTGPEFRITHQEMIKGIRNDVTGKSLNNTDMLVVPIIENTEHEEDLKERMRQAMEKYPECPAVLVRRHGIYVWGPSWEKAKTMCECFDYLFQITVEMHKLGLKPDEKPSTAVQ